MRLRTGSELAVIDVSNSGVLVEGRIRLLPGRHLEVHVVTRDGRVLVRCRVIRSFVYRLSADDVTYRSALAFERSIDAAFAGQSFPVLEPASIGAPSSSYPPAAAPGAVDDAIGVSASHF